MSEASVIVAHAEREHDLAESKRVPSLPKEIIRYGAQDGRTPRLEELMDRGARVDLEPVDPGAPALIFFTSGSTGKPKGVTHTIETCGWMIASAIAGFELGPNDVVLPGSSISHVGGFVSTFMALAVGARAIVARAFDGDELLPLLRRERPTVLIMLPASLFALVRDHSATKGDFRSLRLCLSGGDKVSAELEREYTELTGLTIDEVYGMSEIGHVASSPPSAIELGSLGRLHPGFQASIRGDDGREVETGELGNVWLRSRSSMAGYWMNPHATQQTIRDGWLDTGDVMKCDQDGYLWFGGRKKQIIVHNGSNICPQEIEEALLAHPSIELAGVVGVHDLVHGENVRAYVSLKAAAPRPIAQELIRFARDRVGYKAPEEIVYLEEMPLNPAGKVDRVALKQMAG